MPHNLKEICTTLGLWAAKKGEKYLGNPLFVSQSKVVNFLFLKDKVMSKIEGWKANPLARIGHTTMVQSIIQSIPSYSMSDAASKALNNNLNNKYNQIDQNSEKFSINFLKLK